MANHWTDEENRLIVEDYFAMRELELAGGEYSKTEHARRLLPKLEDRSRQSVEFKHCNISAVLKNLCQPFIDGYKPRGNIQYALIEMVWERLNRPAEVLEVRERSPAAASYPSYKRHPLRLGLAPTLRNGPMGSDQRQMQKAAVKLNWAEQDERNRELGMAGERYALDYEKATLKAAGRGDLAEKVRWVSQLDGDGAGFDILSYTPEAEKRLLEVKTTKLGECTPFYITGNEVKVAEENARHWRLLRLWDFSRHPKGFELSPPLDRHVELMPLSYRASFSA
ncbi:MAG: DUF3883 domain-containing protein [Gammaproteobacteria bacterium AqS3]|nr:DUF3883 domain-containing protein [Gammaproteobacteria bacterium AqS3]